MNAKLFVIIALFATAVSAVYFDVHSEQAIYVPGDNVRVFANVTDTNGTGFAGTIDYALQAPNAGEGEAIVPHAVLVLPNQSQLINIDEFVVADDMAEGEYSILATLRATDGTAGYSEDSFTVEGTLRRMEVILRSCKDAACGEQSNIFVTGETAYLSFEANQEGVSCAGRISTPSGSSRSVSLPTQIQLAEDGTHRVSLECTKPGFVAKNLSIQLGVIREWPAVAGLQPTPSATPIPTATPQPTPQPSNCPLGFVLAGFGAASLAIAWRIAEK